MSYYLGTWEARDGGSTLKLTLSVQVPKPKASRRVDDTFLGPYRVVVWGRGVEGWFKLVDLCRAMLWHALTTWEADSVHLIQTAPTGEDDFEVHMLLGLEEELAQTTLSCRLPEKRP